MRRLWHPAETSRVPSERGAHPDDRRRRMSQIETWLATRTERPGPHPSQGSTRPTRAAPSSRRSSSRFAALSLPMPSIAPTTSSVQATCSKPDATFTVVAKFATLKPCSLPKAAHSPARCTATRRKRKLGLVGDALRQQRVRALAYLAWAFERLGTHRDVFDLPLEAITSVAFEKTLGGAHARSARCASRRR